MKLFELQIMQRSKKSEDSKKLVLGQFNKLFRSPGDSFRMQRCVCEQGDGEKVSLVFYCRKRRNMG